MGAKDSKWKTLSSELLHTNPYFSVRQDAVIKPDKTEGTYYVIEAMPGVFVVALDENQNVYLVELYRYTTNMYSIEVPAGGVDADLPLVAAKRELQEETGLVAGTWKEIGMTYPVNGSMSKKNYVYLATDLTDTSKDRRAEEGITRVTKKPLKKVMAMIRSGEITDSESIIALTLAALHLKITFE